MHPDLILPHSCFIGDMAYDTPYALYLTPILLFQQKRQVLEPIKMSHGWPFQGSAIKVHNFVNALPLVLVLISLATSL
jgi:hypothetical protein